MRGVGPGRFTASGGLWQRVAVTRLLDPHGQNGICRTKQPEAFSNGHDAVSVGAGLLLALAGVGKLIKHRERQPSYECSSIFEKSARFSH